jgi:hypothetical protein
MRKSNGIARQKEVVIYFVMQSRKFGLPDHPEAPTLSTICPNDIFGIYCSFFLARRVLPGDRNASLVMHKVNKPSAKFDRHAELLQALRQNRARSFVPRASR